MTQVISTTEPGEVLDRERRTIETYQLTHAIRRRRTVRLASGTGEVHVDVYPAEVPGGGRVKGSVVFIHGLSGHSLMYAGFLDALSRRGFNVAAVDARGHGRSSGPAGDFTMETVLQDISSTADWVAEQWDGPVAMFGSSLGGFWALAAAGAIDRFDAAVSHWVMLPDMPVTKLDRRMRPMVKLLARLTPRMHRNTKTIANWDAVCDDPRLLDEVYSDPMMTWEYTVRSLASGLEYRPSPPLTQLRVPHLVLIGEKDQMTPLEYTQRVAARLVGDLDMHVVPNAGHMGGLIEHRDEVLGVADLWLTTHLAAAGSAADAGAGREPVGQPG